MVTIETLPRDIYDLLGGGDLLSSVERFRDDIGRMLIRRFASHTEERKATLRMSNIGRPTRQLWYELNGPPSEKITGKTQFKFLYGDIIETLVLFLAEASGHKVERLQEEIEVDGIKGHIDAVIDGVLVDVKSCSPRSFDKFRTGAIFSNDPFGYIGQLSGYSAALGVDRACFIPIEKVAGDIIVFPINTSGYDIHSRIAKVREDIASPTEPERCYEPVPLSKKDKSGNLVLSVGCSYCGHKEHCWRDANDGVGLKTYLYASGPKFFTKVVKEPRVKEDTEEFISPFETKDNNNNNE